MIRISPGILAEIAMAAERAWPEESCGLLIGRRDSDGTLNVTGHRPSPNLAGGNRRDSFEISPQLRFDLMRELRDGPEAIVGHCHSHTDGSAVPSARDAIMAHEPELVWLIVPILAGRAGKIRAWLLTDNRTFRTEPMEAGDGQFDD